MSRQIPQVSVVIPTFNCVDALEVSLRAWDSHRAEEIPFEVVVVDDGSTDATHRRRKKPYDKDQSDETVWTIVSTVG